MVCCYIRVDEGGSLTLLVGVLGGGAKGRRSDDAEWLG
jgi:hypothetical protein